MSKLKDLVLRTKPAIYGMIHLSPLPGTPMNKQSVDQITELAVAEVKIYDRIGIDGIVVENMGDIPYGKSVGPEIVATMTKVCEAVRNACANRASMAFGIQILAGCNREALAVALATNFDFIRAEGFVFGHVADEGYIDACAASLLRYRKTIGADHIGVITDIKKKHSSHAITADLSTVETAKAAEFFLSDGIVITGSTTADPPNAVEVSEVRQAVQTLPIIIGSGMNATNIHHYTDAHCVIVGSSFKHGGHWANAIDPDRIYSFKEALDQQCS